MGQVDNRGPHDPQSARWPHVAITSVAGAPMQTTHSVVLMDDGKINQIKLNRFTYLLSSGRLFPHLLQILRLPKLSSPQLQFQSPGCLIGVWLVVLVCPPNELVVCPPLAVPHFLHAVRDAKFTSLQLLHSQSPGLNDPAPKEDGLLVVVTPDPSFAFPQEKQADLDAKLWVPQLQFQSPGLVGPPDDDGVVVVVVVAPDPFPFPQEKQEVLDAKLWVPQLQFQSPASIVEVVWLVVGWPPNELAFAPPFSVAQFLHKVREAKFISEQLLHSQSPGLVDPTPTADDVLVFPASGLFLSQPKQ